MSSISLQVFLDTLRQLSETDRREQIYMLWKELGHQIMDDPRINDIPEHGRTLPVFWVF